MRGIRRGERGGEDNSKGNRGRGNGRNNEGLVSFCFPIKNITFWC